MPPPDTTPAPTHATPTPATAALPIDLDAPLCVIVVGADPAAEVHDRPIATALADHINRWAATRSTPTAPLAATFCVTDLWYLNNAHLRLRPSISIGSPEVNAFSALVISRIGAIFSVQDQFAIHADPEARERVACCWGTTEGHTRRAVEHFAARHLEAFLTAAR